MKRKEGAFIVAQAAIVIAVLAALALPLGSVGAPQSSSPSTTQTGGPLVFVSPVSPQGLQLEVTLNSSSVQSHGAISGRVEVLNTLDRNVSLSGILQNQNISEWGGDDYICPSGPATIVGFALFGGHFAAGNISAAGQPLQLAPPEVIFCAASMQPVAVTFLPKGDQAVATDDLQKGSSPVTVSVNATTGNCGDNPQLVAFCTGKGLSGYWNDSIPAPGALNFTSPAFAYFPPGEYTMVATDLWDQYAYATFVVEPLPQTTTFTSGASPDGLQLELTLNATTVRSNGAVSAQIEVVNTLNRNVSVSGFAQNANITKWNNDDYFCAGNPDYSLVGYAVFQGHFTAANISEAGSPLRLAPPMYGPCGNLNIVLSAVTFLPNGDRMGAGQIRAGLPQVYFLLLAVELNGTTTFCNGERSGNDGFSCTWATPGLVGYWNDNVPSQGNLFGFTSSAFVHFPSGEYTIVAADDWSQYLYATFVVV